LRSTRRFQTSFCTESIDRSYLTSLTTLLPLFFVLNSFFAFLASLCNYSCPFLYRASFRKLAITVSGSLISVFVSHSEARSRVAKAERERNSSGCDFLFKHRVFGILRRLNWQTLMTTRLRGLRRGVGEEREEKRRERSWSSESWGKRFTRNWILVNVLYEGKESAMVNQLLLWRCIAKSIPNVRLWIDIIFATKAVRHSVLSACHSQGRAEAREWALTFEVKDWFVPLSQSMIVECSPVRYVSFDFLIYSIQQSSRNTLRSRTLSTISSLREISREGKVGRTERTKGAGIQCTNNS